LSVTAALALAFGLLPNFPLPFFELAGRVVFAVTGTFPAAGPVP
jgi:hypothetical protein